ncbi:MAG: hypothetical protein DRJ03_10675 [Chloroflexi bacterium]|nr:MAG: hypothetical protein DRJ03_10675 [Chloroflexota bacterium]
MIPPTCAASTTICVPSRQSLTSTAWPAPLTCLLRVKEPPGNRATCPRCSITCLSTPLWVSMVGDLTGSTQQ